MEWLQAGAAFSDDQRYRYRLWRTWEYGKGTCLFIMLNPSTADASVEDPTVKKCLRYARRWGYGRLEVVNLFAYRGTNPNALVPLMVKDRIGPDNDAVILAAAHGADLVVAAWGTHRSIGDRGLDVLTLLQVTRKPVHALRLTADHRPYHPLYLPDALWAKRIELSGTRIRWEVPVG